MKTKVNRRKEIARLGTSRRKSTLSSQRHLTSLLPLPNQMRRFALGYNILRA